MLQETYSPASEVTAGGAEPPKSVFGDADDLYRRWRVTIQMLDKLKGGVPNNPKMMQGWLASRMGIDEDEELKRLTVQFLQERGIMPAEANWDSMMEALGDVANQLNANGFKRDEHGLYVEDRQVMAMLRESVSVIYTGLQWKRPNGAKRSKTGEPLAKAATSVFRESVHVATKRIYLGRDEPDGLSMDIVKPDEYTDSSLSLVEYVERVRLSFEVEELRDTVPEGGWKRIWQHAERNGLGAGRSQQHGKFVITEWEEAG